VAELIALGMVTSEGIAEEANGRPQNEALSSFTRIWVKRNDQTGIGPVHLTGLKIESAPCESRISPLFGEVGYNSNLEAERAITGLLTPHQEIVLRENLGLPQH
jgi:hypothetical protein